MHLSLTKCTGQHLEELLELSRTTFIDAFAHLNDPDDFQTYLDGAFSEITLKRELNNSNSTFYFVDYDEQRAGYFKLNTKNAQTDISDKSSMEIERIYVLREYQGKGIGRWMLAEIEKIATRDKLKYLWLGVWQKNTDAIGFYENLGFTKFGEHSFYIGKDNQTDWLMRLDITTL